MTFLVGSLILLASGLGIIGLYAGISLDRDDANLTLDCDGCGHPTERVYRCKHNAAMCRGCYESRACAGCLLDGAA